MIKNKLKLYYSTEFAQSKKSPVDDLVKLKLHRQPLQPVGSAAVDKLGAGVGEEGGSSAVDPPSLKRHLQIPVFACRS